MRLSKDFPWARNSWETSLKSRYRKIYDTSIMKIKMYLKMYISIVFILLQYLNLFLFIFLITIK